MKNLMTKYGGYVLAFIIPFTIMGLVFILWNVYPFGDRSILLADQYTQYIQFYNHLYDVISGNNSLLYAWEAGMGLNYWGTFSYYLSSPFSFVIFFFDRDNLPEAFVLMTLIKLGLAGLTMSIYLARKFKLTGISNLMFSSMFALMSFSTGYYFNIMWLDSIYLLPLVLLGVESIYQRKYLLFIISLTLLFISNFYMGYIVGLFTFLYFVYTSFSSREIKIKKVFKNFGAFCVCTLFGVGISAFITIPTYLQLNSNEYQSSKMTGLLDPTFGFFQFIAKLYNSSTNLLDMPNVFTGSLVLLLFPLYFFHSKINVREKVLSILLFVILLLSFQIKGLNIVWHAFEIPTGYLHRFAFVFSFFLIYIAVKAYLVFQKDNIKTLIIILLGNVFILMLLTELTPEIMSIKKALVSILMLLIFSLLLLGRVISTKYKKMATIALLLVTGIDLGLNAYNHIQTLNSYPGYPTSRSQYNMPNPGFEKIVNEMKEIDQGFYRVNTIIRLTPNDSLRFGYKGMSSFNTLSNGRLHEFMNDLGYSTTLGARSIMQNNGVLSTDALFGFKYMITDLPINKHGYKKVGCQNGVCLYKNNNALSIGYMINKTQTSLDPNEANPFNHQNQLIGSANKSREYFQEQKPISTSINNLEIKSEGDISHIKKVNPDQPGFIELNFKLEDNKQFYTLLDAGKGFAGFNETIVYVNGKLLGNYPTFHNERVLDLGAFSNELVNVKIEFLVPETQLVKQLFYALDNEAFDERIQELKTEQFTLKSWSATGLTGDIKANEANTLFFSIPYDSGWTITVDGRETNTKKLGGFMGVHLEKGNHDIKLSYVPKGLIFGSIVSIVSLLVLITCVIFYAKYKSRHVTRRSISE